MGRHPWFTGSLLVLAFAATTAAQELETTDPGTIALEVCDVRAHVEEGFALVDVDQTFRNRTDAIREGIYTFKLPAEAVVHTFSMWMEGREKQGRVTEALQAREIYDSIVRRRADPALLEEIGWRTLRVSVFPIPARDTVRIRLRYAHLVEEHGGLQALEIPLPSKAGVVGGTTVTVSVSGRHDLATVDCPSHADAVVETAGSRSVVRWGGDGVALAPRFVVRVLPRRSGADLALLAHRPVEGEGSFLIRVLPQIQAAAIPRDVVFVIDRSGSMQGPKMRQARRALEHGISTLRERDRFDIVSFATDVISFAGEGLAEVDPAAIRRALAHVGELTAMGGTNIQGALEKAQSRRTDAADRLFLVVLLTDGDPTVGERNPDRIEAWFEQTAGGRTRLFAFGVGDDVKDFLLTRLAHRGRGSAVYVREREDLEVKLGGFFEQVESPLLMDPEIAIEGHDGLAVSLLEPRVLPDVYAGRPVVLTGRFSGGGAATLRLTGLQAGERVSVSIPVTFPSRPEERPHVAQLWARKRVDGLLDDLRVHGMVEEIRTDIVRLGVQYQVVSPYTSFLVVEDGVRIPDAGETARVPEGGGDSADTARGPTTPGGGAGGPTTGGGESGGPGGPTTGGRIGFKFGAAIGGSGGPVGEVPPDSREPSDPPPSGGSWGGPATPGGDDGGPSTGSGSGAGGRGGAGGYELPEYGDWTFWWRAHREELLEPVVSARLAARDRSQDTAVLRVVVPELRAILDRETEDPLVRRAAAIALARTGDPDPATSPKLRTLACADDEERAVREGAVLALGLLGRPEPETVELLVEIAQRSDSRGDFTRAHAAVALGLLAHGIESRERAASTLVRVLADPDADLGSLCCALRGLELLEDRGVVPILRFMLSHGRALNDGRDLDELETTHVVVALGSLGRDEAAGADPAVVGALVELVLRRDRDAPRSVRRAAALALGRIGPPDDPQLLRTVVQALMSCGAKRDDLHRVGESWIALGRIAAHPGCPAATRGRIVAFLEAELKAADRRGHFRPYAALALAQLPGARDAVDLARALKAEGDPRSRSAHAIALGLSGDPTAGEHLRSRVRDSREFAEVRAACFVGLGALGDRRAIAEFGSLAMLGGPAHAGENAVFALGLFGEPAAVPELLRVLSAGNGDPAVLRAAAVALGRIRAESSVAPLLEIARDEDGRFTVPSRRCAISALGRIAAREPVDPLARLASTANHRAYVAALWEVYEME